jgi:hypothetical protein
MRLSKVGLLKTFIEQIWDLQLGLRSGMLKYYWKETCSSCGSNKVTNGEMYLSVHKVH